VGNTRADLEAVAVIKRSDFDVEFIAAEQAVRPKPESGLEPLTYRLQGDTSVRLNAPIMPANEHASGQDARTEFRLISADFGWLRDNGALRCP
jgi:hypothetical protein